MPELNSSNIASADYDEQLGTLRIVFRSGGVYTYGSVPQATYEALIAASSPGQFFARNIRNVYPSVREG